MCSCVCSACSATRLRARTARGTSDCLYCCLLYYMLRASGKVLLLISACCSSCPVCSFLGLIVHRYAVAIKGECEEGLWKQLQLMTAAPQMQQPSTPGQTNAEATNSYLLQIQKTAVSIVRNVNELFKRQ